MPFSFFVRRFFLAFVIASVVITIAQVLKGHPFALAAPDGLLWGAISAVVYTVVLAYKLRKARCQIIAAGSGDEPQRGPGIDA